MYKLYIILLDTKKLQVHDIINNYSDKECYCTRIEQGKPCRMKTKRKIILALRYKISD